MFAPPCPLPSRAVNHQRNPKFHSQSIMDPTKYEPVKTVEGELAVAIATAEEDISRVPSWQKYPCERRTMLPAQVDKDSVLVPTAGNALQAIPKRYAEKRNLLSVTVPWGCRPGSEIWVQNPGDSSLIAATVPPNCYPGQSFFVQIPDEKSEPPVAVMGIPVEESNESSDGNAIVVDGNDVEAVLGLNRHEKK